MVIFKCKMCGGNLEVSENVRVCECAYCGVKQTLPYADDEKKVNLFNRANHLRIMGAFDKAANIYETLISEYPEEAEAYWGLCLCNYGIEYVDDPVTANKIPTCHRASFKSLENDENFQMTLKYADVVAQQFYHIEARKIERIRKDILELSKNEEKYDVFICYKESDNGTRTIDSVIGYDIYENLTNKGLKVFFSRVSLEDKLGDQYEPYIFAALNSAKVMLCIGTKSEYFHAIWVKNEWSRFLELMEKDKTKILIPCFKDIDVYDMPEEFKILQAQDLNKLGAVQDIIRGVEKIVKSDKDKTTSELEQNNVVHAESISDIYIKKTDKKQHANDSCEIQKENKSKGIFVRHKSKTRIFVVSLIVIVLTLVFGVTVFLPEAMYIKANDMMNNSDFAGAYEIFSGLDNYKDSVDKKYECRYRQATAAFDSSDYETASEMFTEIKECADGSELSEKSMLMLHKIAISQAEVGGIVQFGFYEQDADTTNGKEVVDWIVLDVRENRVLLLSLYALDNQKYNNQRIDTIWATSSIRSWLNYDFCKNAFSEEYQKLIIPTNVNNANNPVHGTKGGINTTDRIFLLSYDEAKIYFSTNSERTATLTQYAKTKGIDTFDSSNCWWWLRTPGVFSVDVCGVHTDGTMDDLGCYVNSTQAGVRPAMWVTRY